MAASAIGASKRPKKIPFGGHFLLKLQQFVSGFQKMLKFAVRKSTLPEFQIEPFLLSCPPQFDRLRFFVPGTAQAVGSYFIDACPTFLTLRLPFGFAIVF
jgi:hypothetical protein